MDQYTETLHVPMGSLSEAVVTVTMRVEGISHKDPTTNRQPTARELDSISRKMADRNYHFKSTLSSEIT